MKYICKKKDAFLNKKILEKLHIEIYETYKGNYFFISAIGHVFTDNNFKFLRRVGSHEASYLVNELSPISKKKVILELNKTDLVKIFNFKIEYLNILLETLFSPEKYLIKNDLSKEEVEEYARGITDILNVEFIKITNSAEIIPATYRGSKIILDLSDSNGFYLDGIPLDTGHIFCDENGNNLIIYNMKEDTDNDVSLFINLNEFNFSIKKYSNVDRIVIDLNELYIHKLQKLNYEK